MANIAIFRINYKSDFILTLNSDAGWMTPFCIKFWTGAPSQAYFANFDGTTYTHCAPVDGEPTKLRVQFDDHHLPIGDLQFQIGYHFTVDDFPTSVEDEVLNQASVIIEVDGEPAQVMLDLNGETAPEIEFSLPAYANEAQRIANEEQRIAAEETRIQNEETRISAEQARQSNEEQRITKETERVTEFAEIKTEAVTATNAANAAASLANEKAEYAQAQGDYAKAQGDTALADHERAEADHTTAAADHTQAASDHTQAEADHTTAASDHTTAASDHTQAGQDHTTAAADHTRAESDHTRAENDHAAVEVYVDSLGAFDISAYHATGGVLAKYADLAAALGTGGANIPDALRKGGMSVKFVQSSDNKYVQYRFLLSGSFTDAQFTNVANWQGVDVTPTTNSKNLVESGGVANDFNILKNRAFGEKQIYSHSVTQGVGGNRTTTKHTLVLKKGVYNLSFTNGLLSSFNIFAFSDDTNYIFLGFYSDNDTPVVEVPFDTKYIALYYQDAAALTTGEISFNFVWSNNLEFRLDTITPKAEDAYNKTLCTLESLTFNEGYYKNDGTIENTSAFKCVKISAKAANIITFYNSVSQGDGSVKLIFWDNNNNILRTESQGAIPTDNCNLSIKYLIEGTCYIGINIKTSVISEDEFYYRLGNYNTNDKEYIDFTFSSYSISKKVAPFCLITNSQGTKITGSLAQTISVSFSKPLYNKTISLGIRVPYSTQDLTDITINGKYINRSGNTDKTVSGKYYKMQGDTYQRINIYCDSNGKSSFNIRIGNDCNFEIWISNKAIVNDEMPITPVCFIYDGGHWNGTIEYNGTTYTIWALHRLFGIPYNIATEPNSWDDPSSSEYPLQEVLDDINNGFAGKMLRSGNSTNYWVDDDSIVVPRLNSALNAIEATAKSTVFAQNMFDKQTLRQCKGAGIELVRGYSTDVDEGFFGSKYKDSGLIYIPGNSVAKTMPEHLIKFPVIYWAHGIGQPHGTEAQEYSSFYADQEGVGTLAMFNRIASEMENGNLGVFKIEEFIQYIKTN